jgi:integrase/recombinase XerD
MLAISMSLALVQAPSFAPVRHQTCAPELALGGLPRRVTNKGTLEHAQTLANHASPRTTKLYDRRSDEISLDEVEKISI